MQPFCLSKGGYDELLIIALNHFFFSLQQWLSAAVPIFFPAACLTLGNVPQTDFSIDISFFFLFFFPGDDKKDVKAY